MKRTRLRQLRVSRVSSLNSQWTTCALLLLILPALQALAATPTPLPTTTPTPRPRLSGGFGRPAATPAVQDSSSTASQSLSEVVRAAEDGKMRKDQKSAVAITNDSLVTDTNKGRLTTSSPRKATAPARVAPHATEVPEAPALTPTPSAGAEEAEWRERARSARARVEEFQQRLSQFESEAKKLENDFYSWDDGSYRDGVIKPAWDRKREEIETARKDLAQAQQDLTDLPEKARKAGALPGWLRE